MEVTPLVSEDIAAVSKLIEKSFLQFVAPTLNEEGIKNFRLGVSVGAINKRVLNGKLFLVCKIKTIIVGLVEVRNNDHINLLFVAVNAQNKGVGRTLIHSVIKIVSASAITVNSSLNAVVAYQKYGFIENGHEGDENGIRYQPMIYHMEKTVL